MSIYTPTGGVVERVKVFGFVPCSSRIEREQAVPPADAVGFTVPGPDYYPAEECAGC